MNLEKQVVSLELAKKLKELGVDQDSLFYWREHLSGGDTKIIMADCPSDDDYSDYCSAFTVAELGEMLPIKILKNNVTYDLIIYRDWHNKNLNWFTDYQHNESFFRGQTEADARAKMLIYLLENRLI